MPIIEWVLCDPVDASEISRGDRNFKCARRVDGALPHSAPLLTVKLGDIVRTMPPLGDEPWVGQIVELRHVTAKTRRSPATGARCGIRWLYRYEDFEDGQPDPPLEKREVCWTDHITGPDMNSIEVVTEVVDVAFGVLGSADYFCTRFFWAEEEVEEKEGVGDEMRGKCWRKIGREEFGKLRQEPSMNVTLFWSRRKKKARRQAAKKGTGKSVPAKGEAAFLDKFKMEDNVQEKPKMTLDDIDWETVLPQEQMALVRKSIAGMTDEQFNAVRDDAEHVIGGIVDECDKELMATQEHYEDRRDAVVGQKRAEYWRRHKNI